MTPFERHCREQQLLCRERGGKFSALVVGNWPEYAHWMHLWPLGEKRVGCLVSFPGSKEPITEVDAFCEQLTKAFRSGARLFYSPQDQQFQVLHVAESEKLASELTILAKDCDIAKPVCARLVEVRHADPQLLTLAIEQPAQVPLLYLPPMPGQGMSQRN